MPRKRHVRNHQLHGRTKYVRIPSTQLATAFSAHDDESKMCVSWNVKACDLLAREREFLKRQATGSKPAGIVVIYGTSGVQRTVGHLSESIRRNVGGVDWVVNRLVCPRDPDIVVAKRVDTTASGAAAAAAPVRRLDPSCGDGREIAGAGVYAVETMRPLPGTDCSAIYVGASDDRGRRLQQHRAGGAECSYITRQYGMHRSIATLSDETARPSRLYVEEMYEFLAQGIAHGFHRVRGAMFVKPTLEPSDYRTIRLLATHMFDLCSLCGRPGHKCADCTCSDDPLPFLQELDRLGRDDTRHPGSDSRSTACFSQGGAKNIK